MPAKSRKKPVAAKLTAVSEPLLSLRQTEEAIKYIKDNFEHRLAKTLNLTRVSAPIAVRSSTGINDLLDGIQKPVSFTVTAIREKAEIVQSLAKWKRAALGDYGFNRGEGLYTDMNAIRPDEILDQLHSIYVDQWDWELVIGREERSIAFLEKVVRGIYGCIRQIEQELCGLYPQIEAPFLPADITFIHSQELEDLFPDLNPRERENRFCREKGAVFVIGIGGKLASGQPHDNRAADYDDWVTVGENGRPGLNGDIMVWYPVLNCALELSSMGIRVDRTSLKTQLKLKGEEYKATQDFHRQLLHDLLPLTIGGGIGQSRLCMLLLRRAHVGEVQAGIWPEAMLADCRSRGIRLL